MAKPDNIESRAPTRIDLAGGTLDIWPLHLLVPGAVTVNLAIDLPAVCRLAPVRGPGIRIVSRDRGAAAAFPSLDRMKNRQGLELIQEFVRYFSPRRGFSLETACTAPAGSGLGGSSALAVTLAAALARFCRRRLDRAAVVRLCRDLEARVIRIPTGTQDYLAALHGGCNAIQYGPGGPVVDRLALDRGPLLDRLILCYTGRSRASARSNWDIIRRCVNREPGPLRALGGIAAAAARMRRALEAGDWQGVALSMRREWSWRRRLSPKVGLGGVEPLLRAARRAGAAAGKPCGAGGGGCVLLWCEPGGRDRVETAIRRAGGRLLDFRMASRGLKVHPW